ncbi:MAG TPA: UbiA family prenyltransferase, partial [Gemmatimonadales bacterium]|nr:UbiA family prenyltransferase [Gemmatimonadales bacterium]
MASPSREGQTLGGDSLLVRYANFVRLPHTVFALPFALIGAVAASWVAPVSWLQVVLVVIAFTAARFVAMGFNRIADRDLDAKNPRTASRDIPQGRISVPEAWVSVTLAALVFETAAWVLNPLCFALSPIA